MTRFHKKLFFILVLVLSSLTILFISYIVTTEGHIKTHEKNALIEQSENAFNQIVLLRHWNAQYGGVYVRSKKVNGEQLEPNKYLKDNTLKAANGETLIRINPAWMTRQLSEMPENTFLDFHITSLHPLNPDNRTDDFEKRGLLELEKRKKKKFYYEFDEKNDRFRFIGSLKVKKECLGCHAHQGYELGDTRGGISINLSLKHYNETKSMVNKKIILIVSFTVISLLIAIGLLGKVFVDSGHRARLNEELEKKVEEKTHDLRTQKEHLEIVLNTANSFILIAHGPKEFDVNKSFLDFFKCKTKEEFFEKHICICEFFVSINGIKPEKEKHTVNGIPWVEFLVKSDNLNNEVVIDLNGEKFYYNVQAVRLHSDTEKTLIVMHDVTALQQMNSRLEKLVNEETAKRVEQEKTLVQQAKMAEMGNMIGAITHQLKQPLNTILIAIDLLTEDIKDALTGSEPDKETEDEIEKSIDTIIHGVSHLNNTIDDFRDFFKPEKESRDFSLRELVIETNDLVNTQLKNNSIELIVSENDYPVHGYRNELKQVLLNLINNARDAIIENQKNTDNGPGGNRITIEITSNKNNVILSICDTGGGIPEHIMPDLFKEYVSTKGDQGTGIGLSISKMIVEKGFKGSIKGFNIESGACFEIQLPMVQPVV